MPKRLHLTCPDCGSALVVDAATGEVVSHRKPPRPRGGGHDFDALLEGLDRQREASEARFEQEKKAVADRERILGEKFEEAMRRAEEEPDDGPPLRPWDLD